MRNYAVHLCAEIDVVLGAWTSIQSNGSKRLMGMRRKPSCVYESTFVEKSQFDRSTGMFNAAFTEAVMDSVAFDYSETEEEQWKSVEGGTNLVTEALVDMIKIKPLYNKRVTRMAIDRNAPSAETMMVTANYDEAPRRYSTIINTTTLACLQRVDTADLELSPTVKVALRTLGYDSATKVAIKFDHPWWISKLGITAGGVANTDLPIRVW